MRLWTEFILLVSRSLGKTAHVNNKLLLNLQRGIIDLSSPVIVRNCLQSRDLAQTKFKLLKDSQAKVQRSNVVDFVFADINCALCARLKNGVFKYFFNSDDELNKILGISV